MVAAEVTVGGGVTTDVKCEFVAMPFEELFPWWIGGGVDDCNMTELRNAREFLLLP